MTGAEASARTYRFSPLDRTGWILGLGAAQSIALGMGILAAGLLVRSGAPAPLVFVPVVGALAFAFGAVDRRAVHEWAPTVARFVWLRATRRHRWFAEIPLLTAADAGSSRVDLPPFLAGLTLVDAGPVPWAARSAGVAVVRDRQDRTLSASLPVQGREFTLLEREEQDRLVQLWGDVLAAFCTERGAVSHVRFAEWAAPAGLAGEGRALPAPGEEPNAEAVDDYREVLAAAAPMTARHEVLLTVTVDERRASRRASPGEDPRESATGVLLEELRLLSARLEGAGLVVGPPLSPVEFAESLRVRLDPACAKRLAARASALGVLSGVANPHAWGPLATESHRSFARADCAVHRSYWVAEWPRLEVPASWLEPLLLHASGVRSFAVDLEPVPPSRSRRQVDRDSTRLAADEEQRTRSGFRVGARHRRVQAAVTEREAELVAGYAELGFAGFVSVSAPDESALSESCAEVEQAAAQAGLDIQALEGRHELGLVCCLPAGRGLARRRSP
ncbi:MAG: hypothetical protein HYU28_07580 [Actinobacteria bacterium]|nr:hypothetical protein [Actinomycetota bacterium]